MGDVQRSEGEVSPAAVPPLPVRLRCAIAITLYAAVIYGVTNAIAGARGTTRCIALPWEHRLPLVTWMVVPYLMIDALMALSALFTVRYDQLHTLVRRFLWAFGIGNIIFLVLPLR